MIIKLLLFSIICGLIWMWRGYSVPNLVHGYFRAFLSAFMIVGLYCLWFTEQSVFNINPMFVVVVLTTLESALGYGETCGDINGNYIARVKLNLKTYPNVTPVKERYVYLGFVSMSYYLFPYMILHPNKCPIVYLTIALLGFVVFPFAKYLQLRVFNKIAKTYILDSWKIVEGILGMGFILWLIK